jgi:hypothetical protein
MIIVAITPATKNKKAGPWLTNSNNPIIEPIIFPDIRLRASLDESWRSGAMTGSIEIGDQ